MKTFIFTTETKKGKYGKNITHKVFELIDNLPNTICEVKYNTASCRGDRSEIVNKLVEMGQLPETSLTNGYYNGNGYKLINLNWI